ncbi:helix-turn-helix transcriptional regulator [Candidatus Pacearchaeota archaeon]|nr:helix-turn-helix transcriptional regulator [Candidatus Pacearchaeota archaeon]
MNEKIFYSAYKLFFGTLMSQNRLKILNYLRTGPKNVSQIHEKIKTERTNISHDLRRLKKCGFVNVKVEGKFRYYSLNEETILPLLNIIDNHMEKYCMKIISKKEVI